MLQAEALPNNHSSNLAVALRVAARAWETAPMPTADSLRDAFLSAVESAYLPEAREVPRILRRNYRRSILAELPDVPYQFARLVQSAEWHGEGIPEGKGRGVMFVPGFLGPAWTGDVLLSIFRERGYEVAKADLGRINIRCPDRAGEDLLLQVRKFVDKLGEPVILVGHSLGGAKSGFVLSIAPELVYHAFALGSPLNGKDGVHWLLDWIWQAMAPVREANGTSHPGCANATCQCRANLFAKGEWRNEAHRFTAVVGDDPLVNRRRSTKIGMHVVYIRGAYHCSMIVNPDVIQTMGRRLTELQHLGATHQVVAGVA